MIEYAAFGFATLVWWTWPVMFAVTMAAVYAASVLASLTERRRDERTHHKQGPHICGELVDENRGWHIWCELPCGHDGEHLDAGTIMSRFLPADDC